MHEDTAEAQSTTRALAGFCFAPALYLCVHSGSLALQRHIAKTGASPAVVVNLSGGVKIGAGV